jgi:hypothetical protein
MKKWFSSLGTKSEAGETDASLPQVEPQSSPALNLLYRQLSADRKYHILDLGPACGVNVDFFSQFTCKIYIEDLHQTLTSFDFLSPEDGFSYEAVFEYLFPYWKNTRFDVIMSWDIFNYLEPDEFDHLVRHLIQFCQTGTLLFALISTLKHIPERPTTFRILDPRHLLYQTNSRVLRSCPRYQQTDLNRLMSHFRVRNSFLLRNGFKEYLFVCE